jgi:hypothetical protein
MTFSERGERLRGRERERERREHSEEILFDLLYSIVQCSAVRYGAVQYGTVQYCTLYGAF